MLLASHSKVDHVTFRLIAYIHLYVVYTYANYVISVHSFVSAYAQTCTSVWRVADFSLALFQK